jgi:amino acid adenylation domain-containing protein
MERSLEPVVVFMGILKAGGSYMYLEPSLPTERLIYLIKDSGAQAIVAERNSKDALPELDVPVLLIEDIWNAETPGDLGNPRSPVLSDNLAYIMYTSGSTGKPKGVLISHRNVVGFLYGFKQLTNDGARRVGTSVATFGFDTSVEEIFACLCFGGTLHVMPLERTIDAAYFARYLVEHQVTTSYVIPALLADVTGKLLTLSEEMELRCLITGLEPKKEGVLQKVRDLSPEIRILNAYGPTEVTYGATAFEFESTTNPDRPAPIGRPLPNYQTYVVDAHLQPVPVGVTGELVIGGVGLSRGYRNQPALTAERFVPDAFSGRAGARLYRTGDMVRLSPDGNIDFLGRADDQVKLRGYRIELGEIEATLAQYPQVYRTVAMVREDRPGDRRLVAYVMPRPGAHLSTGTLREFLQRKLPAYMLPSFIVLLDALPLLPNDKVDRRALPSPEPAHHDLVGTCSLPRTPTEESLAEIWRTVLGVDEVSVDDDFFELGGHSLLAIKVVTHLRRRFDVEFPLRRLFEAPTIAALAESIETLRWLVGESRPSPSTESTPREEGEF